MDLSRLASKHSIKLKTAARMNGAVAIFLDSILKVNVAVESGVTVNDMFISVMLLATPAKKVTISNVPPFIKDETLINQLAKYGKIISPIKKVPSGCKSPLLKYVVSHRRNVLMIRNNRTEELSLAFKIRVDDFDCYFCFFRQ